MLFRARICAEVWPAGSGATGCGSGSPVHRQLYAYDFAGRLVSETVVRGGASRTVSYGYDANSNRTSIRWPDGYQALYEYDALDRLSHVREDADGNGVSSDVLMRLIYAWGRHVETRWGADASGQAGYAGAVLWEREADGDLAAARHRDASGATIVDFTHGYDGSGRVTSSLASASGWLWTPESSRTVTYGEANVLDQYPDVNLIALVYDGRGNRTDHGELSTLHDSDNRLTAAAIPSAGMGVEYFYDADGRRVAKDFASGGADVSFLHAGDMEIAEYSASGQLLRRYIPGAGVDDRAAMVEADGTRHYYRTNRLGSVIAVMDAAGAVTDRYVYTPFGVQEPLIASGNPFRYTGRRYDPETGFYYYRARYLDAEHGRFLQPDPVLYADQMNLYAYVGNDPLNATDPTGLCEMRDDETRCDDPRAQRDFRSAYGRSAASASERSAFRQMDTGNGAGNSQHSPIFTFGVVVGGTLASGPVGADGSIMAVGEFTGNLATLGAGDSAIIATGNWEPDVTAEDPRVAGAAFDGDLGIVLAVGGIDDIVDMQNPVEWSVDAHYLGFDVTYPESGFFEPADNLFGLRVAPGASVRINTGVGGIMDRSRPQSSVLYRAGN